MSLIWFCYRNFCKKESSSEPEPQDTSGGNYALGLIVFSANDCPGACPVQPSAWTTSFDIFIQWLSALSFDGGGQHESAIAEGLSNALMNTQFDIFSIAVCSFPDLSLDPWDTPRRALTMFPSDLSGIESRQLGQRHCILVVANNPSPVPRAVLLPKTQILDSGEISKVRIECQIADAEAVARSFPQSFVSLSVICPRQLPKLRLIFNAGNTSYQAAGSSANEFKHPQLLVLVSESFIEAHVALKQLEAESRLIFRTEPDLIPPFSDNFSEDDLKNLSQIIEPLTSQPEISGEKRNYDNGKNLTMLWTKPRDPVQPTLSISANSILTEAEELGINALRSKGRSWKAQSLYDQETSYARIPSTEACSGLDVDDRLSSLQLLSADPQRRKRARDHFCGASTAKYEKCTKMKQINAIGQANGTTDCVNKGGLNQASILFSKGSGVRYIQAWEGGIISDGQGQIGLVNRVLVYRKESQSVQFFANWPQKLHLAYFLHADCLNNRPFGVAVQYLILDAVAPSPTLDLMVEKRLCGYIKLPQQTSILFGSHTKQRFIGSLFEGVYPLFNHQIYSPEQCSFRKLRR